MTLVVRSPLDMAALLPAIRAQIKTIDAQLPLTNARSAREVVRASLGTRPGATYLLVALGALAMLLAAIGIYGIFSYHVTQRTQEMAIRLAVGAQRAHVLGLVIGNAMRLAGLGLGCGLLLALGLTRLLSKQLFGVRPSDPLTFAVIAGTLALVALVASYLPARRATRVDPMLALRYEG